MSKNCNEALLGKWGWELATNQNHFWPRIVMSKYGGWNALIHGRNSTAFSNWWKDLKSIFQQQHTNRLFYNLCWKLGNGAKIRFWKDKWREDDLTLQEKYPTLYQVSYQQDSSISLMGILVDNKWEWRMQWRRNWCWDWCCPDLPNQYGLPYLEGWS